MAALYVAATEAELFVNNPPLGLKARERTAAPFDQTPAEAIWSLYVACDVARPLTQTPAEVMASLYVVATGSKRIAPNRQPR